MTEAPSIKEALENVRLAREVHRRKMRGDTTGEELAAVADLYRAIDAALATLSQPTADRREIVARIIDPTAFSCTPKVYGLKNQAELEKLTMVGAARRIAREKATKILTALDGGTDA